MNQSTKEIQRVVYVTNDGLTDPLGQSQIIPYLCKLQNKDREIHIVSAEKKENFLKDESTINTIIEGKNIQWHPIRYRKSLPLISRYLTYRNLLQKAKKLILSEKTIVHGRSDIGSLVGLKLKQKFGSKLVFDMRGFWADERWDGNIWNRNNAIHRMLYERFKSIEKRLYHESDAIVSLTYDGQNILKTEYNVDENKITVIPCCTDRELFNPKNVNEEKVKNLKAQLEIHNDDQVICYLGSLGTWYMLEEMLEFFKTIAEKKQNVKFLFITRDNPKKIFSVAKALHISINQIIVRSATRKEVPTYISCSDIGIFFIKPCYSKRASSPTKMGEFLSMGLSVIGNGGVGDVNHIIEQYQCGFVVENLDSTNYRTLADDDEALFRTKEKESLKAADEYFDLLKGVEKYETIYGHLYS